MRLWMIAATDLWQELQRSEQLLCNPEYIDLNWFQAAYDWMRRQMERRLLDYRGYYPWWAWTQWESGHPRPDLRSRSLHGGFAPGAMCVRLELEIPRHEILCSDYNLWNIVLNEGYIALNKDEYEYWEHLPLEQQTKEALEMSWTRIFDLEHNGADPKWIHSKATKIQAVFEVLRLADVRRITYFRARPRSHEAPCLG